MLWKIVMDDFPDLPRRRPEQEGNRSDRQEVRKVLEAEPDADSRRSAVQGLLEAGRERQHCRPVRHDSR